MDSLLPLNASHLERAACAAAADLVEAKAPLHTLWDAQRIPEGLLPWLAWAVGVDVWSADWPVQVQRDVVQDAIAVRHRRGTVWAVRRALEAAGFRDVEVIEHAQADAAWQQAGGAYIDGSFLLSGDELSASGMPRVVTTSWAQYALAFDAADASLTAKNQRLIRERVSRAAPLRSELVALIMRFYASWKATIGVSVAAQSVSLDFGSCGGARVARAVPIMGCWSLSGDYAPRLIGGGSRLRADWRLSGAMPIGPPLDQGWGTVASKVRQTLKAGMAPAGTATWSLGESSLDRLDGRWWLDEVISGRRSLSGLWAVGLGVLSRSIGPLLGGVRQLGGEAAGKAISTTGRALIRDGRHVVEVAI
jgi:phage tail P2-like protein